MNNFERATRSKLRFGTAKGLLSVEDLWDLSLQSLNSLAQGVNKKLKEQAEESFIEEKSEETIELQLKLDILKYIIQSKLTAQEASKKASETKAKIAQLQDLIVNKQNDDLKGKSVEELTAMLEQLKA